ncbi:MAG: hypothetical protein IPL14_20805 [Nitrospira sp.]|nr:hypothetical protein [Nitrospira sp.]
MPSSAVGGLMLEYAADWQESLVQRAEQCARSITYVAGELIRERFRLGGIVVEALERSQHGDAVVVKMAERMSAAVGKCIRPHMLYESARIYNAFGGQWERIEALRAQLSFPLSYSYLVRFCLPALTMDSAWNAEQVTYSNDSELRGFESAVLRIEARVQAHRTRQQEVGKERSMDLETEGFVGHARNPQNFQEMAVRTILCGARCVVRGAGRKGQQRASNWRRYVSRRRQSRDCLQDGEPRRADPCTGDGGSYPR